MAGTERPMRADARRNRARVLETAESVFVEQGLSIPVEEIARRAGVGVGTVYRHFPTKDALFEAIVVDRVRWLIDEARSLARSDTPDEAFYRYVRDLVELSAVNRTLYAALAEGGDTERLLGALAEEFKSALRRLLTRAQRAGAVRKDVGVVDLKALIVGTQLAINQGGAPRRMTDVLCDGLRPPASRDAPPREAGEEVTPDGSRGRRRRSGCS